MQTAALVEEPTLWLSAPTEAYQQWQRTEAAGADRRAFSPRSIVQHEERVARSKSIWLECAFFVRTKRLWSECSNSKSMWSGCKSPQTAYFLSGALRSAYDGSKSGHLNLARSGHYNLAATTKNVDHPHYVKFNCYSPPYLGGSRAMLRTIPTLAGHAL